MKEGGNGGSRNEMPGLRSQVTKGGAETGLSLLCPKANTTQHLKKRTRGQRHHGVAICARQNDGAQRGPHPNLWILQMCGLTH